MDKLTLEILANGSQNLLEIGEKILDKKRISNQDAILLFEEASPGFVGALANHVRTEMHGNITYFNRNFHIEPTNICVFDCKFCAYSRLLKNKDEGWEHTAEEMIEMVRAYDDKPVTEVHIVGGVHPKMNLEFFGNLIKEIKKIRPTLHIKAFTAVEYDYMFRKAKMTPTEGFTYLKECGLESLPGGGAEIFDPEIRMEICADKCDGKTWLAIHKAAHELDMHSNATMLYGHIEEFKHRVNHMESLRNLQDETGGFNTFIPLKFRNGDNQMSHIPESSIVDDLKTYAIARLYLDNFNHIKAYWPMIGREVAQLLMSYGVNDLDGTIDDTTKIYSMAGAEEQTPTMTTDEIVKLIFEGGKQPIERDTLYNTIKEYSNVEKVTTGNNY